MSYRNFNKTVTIPRGSHMRGGFLGAIFFLKINFKKNISHMPFLIAHNGLATLFIFNELEEKETVYRLF